MQFRAGPGEQTFYACEAHRAYLERAVPNFFLIFDDRIEPVDPHDEVPCDFCREGA